MSQPTPGSDPNYPQGGAPQGQPGWGTPQQPQGQPSQQPQAASRDHPSSSSLHHGDLFDDLAVGACDHDRDQLEPESGVVEAVGANVTKFAPGDRVIAMMEGEFGGHAQYVCIPQDAAIARAPASMSLEEAVTLVFGGITAEGFFKKATITSGTTVLGNLTANILTPALHAELGKVTAPARDHGEGPAS